VQNRLEIEGYRPERRCLHCPCPTWRKRLQFEGRCLYR